MPKIVNTWNEWDPLKRVIVGRADGACIHAPEPGWMIDCPRGGFPLGTHGPFPQEMIDVANERLDAFCQILGDRGAVVDRAVPIDFHRVISTPDWETEDMHPCMPPRDVLLPVGNEILECTMSIRARWYEYLCYRPILEEYFRLDPEFAWTAAPKPRLSDESYDLDYFDKFVNVWTDEEKEKRLLERKFHLTDKEPLFDAADGARCGKDIFWQGSAVSNRPGIDWLRRHFGPKGIRIHVVQFANDYLPWHIDVNLVPLRPGLMMYNPEWYPITPELTELMKINDWELVPAADPVHEYDLSPATAGRDLVGPQWIAMNSFSIDPKTICVEATETKYQEQLDKLGFDVVPVEFSEVFPFGGGLHCATIDVYREGDCEDYFPKQVDGF
jgi:glycine amidinotransferase